MYKLGFRVSVGVLGLTNGLRLSGLTFLTPSKKACIPNI